MIALQLAAMGALLVCAAAAHAEGSFDRTHAAWSTLLAAHVRWNASGTASVVDYAAFARDRAALDAYRDALAQVTEGAFMEWPVAERLAFLINAYNAHTVALVLTRYPDLESIKDLGGWLSSPWKQQFVTLLGARRSLDDIEHTMIRRGPGRSEPRVHFALNCASVGCPALRPEAYGGDRLESQLADQTHRFLIDRSRNRHVSGPDRLQVSKIFDWYAGDFARAAGSTAAFLGRYAAELDGEPAIRRRIAAAELPIEFLDYDWRLNDARASR